MTATLPAELLPLLAELAAKATLLLAATALAAGLLRGASAAVRHLVWCIGVTAVLALPLLSAVLPPWSVALPRASAAAAQPAVAAPAPAVEAAFVGALPSPAVSSGAAAYVGPPLDASTVPAAPAAPAGPAPRLSGILAWLAAAGTLLGFAWMAAGFWGVRRLAGRAHIVDDQGWREAVSEASRRLGLRRPVRLLQSDAAGMPATWGVILPAVVLPSSADTWPADRRHAVLAHELAHVKRFDCLTQTLAQACCALFWWHPGAWYAARRLRIERERACDDLVLETGARASDYAGHLLEIARGWRRSGLASPALVPMAKPSQLEGRLLAVLDAARSRGMPSPRASLAAALCALALVAPLAAMRPAAPAPGEAAGERDSGPAASFAAASADAQETAWRGTLRPGQTLAVHGISGGITASGVRGSTGEVRAERRVRRGDAAAVRIEAVEHAGGVTVCALWQRRDGGWATCGPDGLSGQIDGGHGIDADVVFTASVPEGVHFVGATVSGDVRAEGIGGNARVTSVSGNVAASAAGHVRATTVSGDVEARMGATDWSGRLSLTSISGNVRVWLPEGAAADVNASSFSGDIRSEFPLEAARRRIGSRATGRIGAGGRQLSLQTMSGSVRIHRAGSDAAALPPPVRHAAPYVAEGADLEAMEHDLERISEGLERALAAAERDLARALADVEPQLAAAEREMRFAEEVAVQMGEGIARSWAAVERDVVRLAEEIGRRVGEDVAEAVEAAVGRWTSCGASSGRSAPACPEPPSGP
jgi:beta-lactamase regulating signal transducer with metallopeptidase domain